MASKGLSRRHLLDGGLHARPHSRRRDGAGAYTSRRAETPARPSRRLLAPHPLGTDESVPKSCEMNAVKAALANPDDTAFMPTSIYPAPARCADNVSG